MSTPFSTPQPLATLRRVRLHTQESLAEAAGIHAATIIDIEQGRTTAPHQRTMRALCKALDVEPLEVAEFAAAITRRAR